MVTALNKEHRDLIRRLYSGTSSIANKSLRNMLRGVIKDLDPDLHPRVRTADVAAIEKAIEVIGALAHE